MKRLLRKSALLSLVVMSIGSTATFGQSQQRLVTPKVTQIKKFTSVGMKSSYGELDPCLTLLSDGLTNNYVDQNGLSFFSDSRSYFLSEKFKSDYKNGKWNGGISIVTDGIPIGLDAGASEDKLKQFQEKIQKATSVEVRLETFSTISRSTLDIELAEAFNNCLAIKENFGLSIMANGEKTIEVTIRYKAVSSNDRKPLISSVDLLGISEIDKQELLKGRLRKGTPLADGIAFTATRIPGEEFLIALNTSNGLSIVKRVESEENANGSNLPIGTVIASMLDFDAFSKLTKNNARSGVWSPKKSKWAPCDGRLLMGSKYHELWAGSIGANAPDLRGVFLRGLNQFDIQEQAVVSSGQANPQNMKRGQYQSDEIKSHSHTYKSGEKKNVSGKGSKSEYAWGPFTYTTNSTGGEETRPKNVSVYYYIRIN